MYRSISQVQNVTVKGGVDLQCGRLELEGCTVTGPPQDVAVTTSPSSGGGSPKQRPSLVSCCGGGQVMMTRCSVGGGDGGGLYDGMLCKVEGGWVRGIGCDLRDGGWGKGGVGVWLGTERRKGGVGERECCGGLLSSLSLEVQRL